MSPSQNINDLLVNFRPKVIRFTGEKFPAELWNAYSATRNVKSELSTSKNFL